MTIPRWTGWVALGVVLAAILVKALTQYTFASDGPGSLAIRLAIAAALGDAPARAPAVTALTVFPVSRELSASGGPAGPRRVSAFEPAVGRAAEDWARAAAAADSPALRAWITAPLVTTRAARDDSVFVTSRRLTVHAGCPLVSTLRGAFTRGPEGGLRLARLSATCPAVEGGAPAPR